MTEQEFINILPLFKGSLKEAREALAKYPEIGRLDIGAIRKILGYSSGDQNHKLTDEQREEMISEYKAGGTSLHKLAKKYGINVTCVREHLIRRNINTQTDDRWTKIKKLRLITLRKAHHSYSEIGRCMGLSTTAIVHHARQLGFPPENSGLDPYAQTFQPDLDND